MQVVVGDCRLCGYAVACASRVLSTREHARAVVHTNLLLCRTTLFLFYLKKVYVVCRRLHTLRKNTVGSSRFGSPHAITSVLPPSIARRLSIIQNLLTISPVLVFVTTLPAKTQQTLQRGKRKSVRSVEPPAGKHLLICWREVGLTVSCCSLVFTR